MQQKDAMAFAYGNSPPAGVTIGADQETAKVAETPEKQGDDVEREEVADVPEMGDTPILPRFGMSEVECPGRCIHVYFFAC